MAAPTIDQGQLEALLAAVSEGTFDAAARALHVTPSAVSQRIKALETRVGRVLVTRSKPVAPTASGAVLLRAARQMQAIGADVLAELGDEASAGPAHRAAGGERRQPRHVVRSGARRRRPGVSPSTSAAPTRRGRPSSCAMEP